MSSAGTAAALAWEAIPAGTETLSTGDELKEAVFLGLRPAEGLDIEEMVTVR